MGPVHVDLNILHFCVTDTDEMAGAAKSSQVKLELKLNEWLDTSGGSKTGNKARQNDPR